MRFAATSAWRRSCRRLASRLFGFVPHRNAILQELRAGNDDVVAGLQSIQHCVVVADGVAELQQLLPRHAFLFPRSRPRTRKTVR